MSEIIRVEVHTGYVSNDIMSSFLDEAFNEIENIFREMKIPNPKEESKIFSAIIDGVCFHYLFDKENYPLDKMRKYLIKKYCI